MEQWMTVGRVTDLPPGTARTVETGDLAIALFNVEGNIYALDNTCPHAGGPLGEGTLIEDQVECPWHGWRYHVRTGERPENPDFKVPCFRVQVKDGAIQVCLPGPDTKGSESG